MYQILQNRALIEIEGIDALQFLQNIVTNNVNQDYCYSAMLTSNGRYLFDFFIIKRSSSLFWIDIEAKNADAFMKKMRFFKLRRKIEIKNISDEFVVIYSDDKKYLSGSIFSAQDSRFKKLGFRSIFKTDSDVFDCFKLENSEDKSLYMKHKYQFALPDTADMIAERSVILEYGMQYYSGVDFHKGCYLGQEFISRTHSQGVIRKKIFKIIATASLDHMANNQKIIAGSDTQIGTLLSAYGNLGIGLINEEKLGLAMDSNQGVTIDQKHVKISTPEWMLRQ